jgi:hypothetical protein
MLLGSEQVLLVELLVLLVLVVLLVVVDVLVVVDAVVVGDVLVVVGVLVDGQDHVVVVLHELQLLMVYSKPSVEELYSSSQEC